MNELGTGLLKVLESSSLGRMSVYVITKQSHDLGIDLDTISPVEAGRLVSKLGNVLPFFLADETNEVITNMKRFVNNGNMVMT